MAGLYKALGRPSRQQRRRSKPVKLRLANRLPLSLHQDLCLVEQPQRLVLRPSQPSISARSLLALTDAVYPELLGSTSPARVNLVEKLW
jgi:hypothetical protein